MKKGYLLLGFLASALSISVNAQDIKLINPDEGGSPESWEAGFQGSYSESF